MIQKLRPSLVAPKGRVLAPVGKEPRGVRSAAFQRETLLPAELVTRMRWPSKAAAEGPSNPLPVSVWMTAPVDARTTVTELGERLGTQMFVPSKAGCSGRFDGHGLDAAGRISLKRPLPFRSVTQMLAPSKRMPIGLSKSPETVVTAHGVVAPGVTMDTEPDVFAVQMRAPSKAMPRGPAPRLLVTVVTAPAGCAGSIM